MLTEQEIRKELALCERMLEERIKRQSTLTEKLEGYINALKTVLEIKPES